MQTSEIDLTSAHQALDMNYILLLTTNSVERKAVQSVIKNIQTVNIDRNTRGAKIGRLGDRFCIHLNGTSGAQDAASIGPLTRWIIQSPRPRPQMVLVVGFAWGNPEYVNTGDVIISSKIQDVNHARMEKGIITRRAAERTSSIGTLSHWVTRLPKLKNGGNLLCGDLASAEVHLSDTLARDSIIKQFPLVLGGEMEAFDVVRDLPIPWLFIKGVSDFGDNDVGRVHQREAAEAAASLILPALEFLTEEGALENPRKDDFGRQLTDALLGHSIRISRPAGDRRALVDAMNKQVPRIMERIFGYASGHEKQDLIAETLAVAIAELAQNAFHHGAATYINCEFNETSVSVSDNGSAFDPHSLIGKRGGAAAWSELVDFCLATQIISFTTRPTRSGGNSYKFVFNKIDKDIRSARNNCTATRTQEGSDTEQTGFYFNPECETLFYEAVSIFSKSKFIDVDSDVRKLLESGRSLIIACRDQRQASRFEKALSDFAGPQLRIFVKSRL